ncbi:light-harvesting protein [Sandarakinorhabdus sp.]|jgi:light-harvesting protein B-800-850 alpha chain|uniref:light-harvesting protein n=1 Tax=Sandarakinorhabdus sp. TaxID=1916663 RepID=UPI003565E058
MNEGRIWLYVNPSVGLPLFFLVWVAGTALMVHLAVLYNTTWYPAFFQGNVAAVSAAPAVEAAVPVVDAMAPAAQAPAEAAPAVAASAEAAK